MDRNLALEVVRATEAAALASARLMGRGDRSAADQAAAVAMRQVLSDLAVNGRIVISDDAAGEAALLGVGDRLGKLGDGDVELDLAVDSLDGAHLCATGGANAISAIAMAEPGQLLPAPASYMEKIAVGPGARGAIDLRRPPKENLRRIADALGKYVEDLTVVILDRPRHEKLVGQVREAGARIKLLADGDLAGVLSTCFPETGIDALIGIGGSLEGVISAAAVRCVGGDMQGRFAFRSDAERARAREQGMKDPDRLMTAEDLASGSVMFAATGVTRGDFLKGVVFTGDGARTHSVVMRSRTGTIRFIESIHHFTRSPNYGW
jgi:fructose-1,6-bisphosphatase II